MVSKALISVSDKTGVTQFARELASMGVGIISTGGTAKTLRDAGIQVTEISDYTGFPEILDGRLKTLHPKVHGGLLGIRGNKKHTQEMSRNAIEPIDLLVVNLYPFEETIAKPDSNFNDAIENIDIGGPALLRAAAKNHEDVAVVCDTADYKEIIAELKERGGTLSAQTKFRLGKKAFAHTARYDSAIAAYLNSFDEKRDKLEMPSCIGFQFEKIYDLRYGENPHQKAAFYGSRGAREGTIAAARQLHGRELSYNNIMDADAALEVIYEFGGAPFAAAIIKHTNPCGVALSKKSLADAFTKALACDPVSAFGGIVALSRSIDEITAKEISKVFFEVVVAPSFDEKALEILKQKKNIRLLAFSTCSQASQSEFVLRRVSGGLLVQNPDVLREDVRKSNVVTKRRPTEEEWTALDFAWRVAKNVKSNAIVFASPDCTLGIGAGQTSRVDSVKIAAGKLSAKGGLDSCIVVASDGFFPFRDGVDEAARAGATAIIEPGGSIRDDEVIAVANEHGLAMVFTGVRHFKH